MKTPKIFFSICLSLLFIAGTVSAQDTWKTTDGPTKYTAPTDVQTDFEKSNAGKIVFSSKGGLEPADVNAGNTISSFIPSDNIYCTVIMTTCLSNYKIFFSGMTMHNADSKYFVYVYIDGVRPRYKLAEGKLSQDVSTKSSFHIAIKTSGDNALPYNPSFNNSLDALSAGDHKIKIELWAGIEGSRTSQVAIASGEFTYSQKAAAKAALGSFSDIKAGMNNPALESNILEAMKSYAKAAGWSENYTTAKIISTDWTIMHNEATGAILGRTVMAALKATWPDGHCSYQVFTMEQQYNGSGYESSVTRCATGEQGNIDCK